MAVVVAAMVSVVAAVAAAVAAAAMAVVAVVGVFLMRNADCIIDERCTHHGGESERPQRLYLNRPNRLIWGLGLVIFASDPCHVMSCPGERAIYRDLSSI